MSDFIKQITEMGIKIFCRFNIATQRELDILAQQYDAVVLAMGTLKPNKINAVFSGCEQVEDGLDFLLRTNEQNSKFVGKNVVVIGGGYTAMDCSRTALRLGASSVKTFYRRDIGDLVILPGELEELRNEICQKYPIFQSLNTLPLQNKLDFGKDRKIKKRILDYTISNFYMTDVISRSSITMAQCTKEILEI